MGKTVNFPHKKMTMNRTYIFSLYLSPETSLSNEIT